MKIKLQTLLKHNWRTLLLLCTLITASQGILADQYWVIGDWAGGWGNSDELTYYNTNTYRKWYIYNGRQDRYFRIKQTGDYNHEFGVSNSNIVCSCSNYELWADNGNAAKFWCEDAGEYVIQWYCDSHKLAIWRQEYALVGTMNNWDEDENRFGTGTTCSVEIALDASTTYEFKIKAVGENTYYTCNSCEITSSISNWTVKSSDSNNISITTSDAGTYTFTFDISNKKLSVKYPVYRTFVENEYIYFKNGSGYSCNGGTIVDNWVAGSSRSMGIKLTKTDNTTAYAWFDYVAGTGSGAGTDNAIYRAKIPAGTYKSFIITRNSSRGTDNQDPTSTDHWNSSDVMKYDNTLKLYNQINNTTANTGWSGTYYHPAPSAPTIGFTGAKAGTSGTGTSENPYIVTVGDEYTITQSSSPTGGDAGLVMYYTFDNSSYSTTTSTTVTQPDETVTPTRYYQMYAKQCIRVNTSECSSTTRSNPTDVYVLGAAACSSAPVIGTQPQDTEVCNNGSASLTIAATITVGTPTYQWYTCNADGTGESPIGGATGSSYTLPTSTPGTYYYKCKASGCGETTDSNVATVTVDATSVAGSISALANPICSGTGTTLSIPNGNTGSITQWQYYNTASSQWTNLETSAEQATGNLTAATQYKAYVKNGVCDAVASSTYTVNLKTAPSKPSISGNEIMCGPSASGAYTYTSTDVSADSYSWTVTGATLNSGSGTRSITVTAGDVDDSPVTIAVTAVNCPNNTPLSTAADNFSARIFKSASAGTVNLTKNSVCVNESGITASRAGTWYSGGGTYEWSTTSGTGTASIDSETGAITALTAGTVTVKCTIDDPACGSTANSSAALTIKSTPIFSITPATPSGTAWKPISLSTSPSQAGAEWSITTNHSDAADVSSVGYLSTDEGSSTVFKGPAPASSGTNTFVVQATVTDGSSNCTTTVSKNVNVDYESCE